MSRLGDTRVSGISPRRVVIVGGIIGVVLLYLLVGLAVRQIFKREDYLNQYERQSSRYVTMPAARGDILDRHGNVLVSSRPRYSVVIDLGSLREEFSVEARKDIRAARREQKKFSEMKVEVSRLRASAVTKVVQKHLDRLNRVLGRSRVLDPAEVSRHLNEKRAIPFTLAKKLTPEEKARFLEAYPTDAPEQLFVESERTYPHGKLAAHLLGRLISDDGEFRDDLPGDGKNLRVMSREGKQGSFGIERRFDETIRGRDGYQLWQVDNLGYLHKKLDERLPEKGAPFISSLDLELQKATESALESRSRAGAAIVLDVDAVCSQDLTSIELNAGTCVAHGDLLASQVIDGGDVLVGNDLDILGIAGHDCRVGLIGSLAFVHIGCGVCIVHNVVLHDSQLVRAQVDQVDVGCRCAGGLDIDGQSVSQLLVQDLSNNTGETIVGAGSAAGSHVQGDSAALFSGSFAAGGAAAGTQAQSHDSCHGQCKNLSFHLE